VGWTWTKDLSTDVNFYDLAIAYDENGNITRTEDNIHTAGAAGSGNGLFDALYTMDGVNRLLRAKEGHWDGSTVTDGNAKRDEVWTLEQTGNWEFFKRDLDGDLDYTDTNELKDRRTHNVVNELLTRDTDDNSSVNYTFTYDDNGNMTDDGQRYTYKWDAFGRLKEVRNRSNSALVAEYKYNGLGYRIGWHYDTDADGTVESNSDDPWYLFVYDDRWRILNTYRLLEWAYNASNPAASYAKERFVYHNAGLGGWGGSSYIDSVMLRDRDADTAWNAASDGTMEERVYYAQNFRHDVSALITSDGRMIEWVKYSSYGVPWSLPAGDTDSDGDFDATDVSAITGTYDVRKDVSLDGTVDVQDFLEAIDLNTGYVTLGWSKLGASKWGNRKGYAGYEGDTALAGTKWHVRHRVLESELGRWMRRDPAGYADGPQLNGYASFQPLIFTDPLGLRCDVIVPRSGDCQPGGGGPINPGFPIIPPWLDYDPWVSFVGCTMDPCMIAAITDPQVRSLMQQVKNACALGGGGATVTCMPYGAGCQQSTAPVPGNCTASNITLCALPCRGSNDLGAIQNLKNQLIHELVHARQMCQMGCDFNKNCRFAVCAEIEAYCTDFPSSCNPGSICSLACGSAKKSCGNGNTQAPGSRCMTMCSGLGFFNSCKDDGDPRTIPPVPPPIPAPLPPAPPVEPPSDE
jgi:RHS repeat-associated protein